jgi:hypothetical protein
MAGAFDRNIHSGKNWAMTPVTPSTLSVSIFNPKDGTACFLPGPAPKYFKGDYLKFTQIWNNTVQEHHHVKAAHFPAHFVEGHSHWAKAQACNDKHDFHRAYHHLQLAKDLLSDQSEGPVISFFFCVLQYLHSPSKSFLPKILSEIHSLKNHLPPYLEDHSLIFIGRLERLIYSKSNTTSDQIKNPHLKIIFEREQNIPLVTLYQITKISTLLKMELADIIYLY